MTIIVQPIPYPEYNPKNVANPSVLMLMQLFAQGSVAILRIVYMVFFISSYILHDTETTSCVTCRDVEATAHKLVNPCEGENNI